MERERRQCEALGRNVCKHSGSTKLTAALIIYNILLARCKTTRWIMQKQNSPDTRTYSANA